MDRQRLKKRFWWVLAVGGLLIVLTKAGTLANDLRLRWADLREDASHEEMHAESAAADMRVASQGATAARSKGDEAEAAGWERFLESAREREALHRRRAADILRRW